MSQVSSTNGRAQKLLEQYRNAVENIAKFFEELGVEAHTEVVAGSQFRSFFLEARRDLHDLDPRFFMFKILDEHVTEIIAEYVAGGHARTIVPIVVDRYYNVIAGYPILELVREYRKDLDNALFVVYKTDLDVNNDIDFVKAVLIWYLTDYLILARHVAPFVHSVEGREVKLGLEHLAVILALYVKTQIGEQVLNELPPKARVLVGDMFEKILSDESTLRRVRDLVETLRVIKHGKYVPTLSFLTRIEPLLTFVEKHGKETMVRVAETVPLAKIETALAEVGKVEEKESEEKAEEVEELEEVPLREVELPAPVHVEEEEEKEVEEKKPTVPKVDVYFTVDDAGVPKLCIRCPNCGTIYSERARYVYDSDVEFRCPKCGHSETIPRHLLESKVRTFIASNVKARLEVVDITVADGIRGRCPLCGNEIVTDETTYIMCSRCGLRLEIPSDAFDKLQRLRDENPLEGTVISLDASRIVVKCPYCGHENTYTKIEQIVEGCRATCRNCNYTFKIPEDRYSEWTRLRKSIEMFIRELYEFAEKNKPSEELIEVITSFAVDSARLDMAMKMVQDVLGNFEKLKTVVKYLADKVVEEYDKAIELRRSGLEEEAAKKLANARRIYKIVEAIVSKYGVVEFEQDYDRVQILLDPDKYVEERLRTELADAYARFSKEIRDLMETANKLVEKWERESNVPPQTLVHVRKALADGIVYTFSRVYSMLYSSRDVYGLRSRLEHERSTIPEKMYSLLKTVMKCDFADVDTVVYAVSKLADFDPVVLPLPNMLTTEAKRISDEWKSMGVNVSQTVVHTVAYMIGLSIVRKLQPDDVVKLLIMLDPSYGLDAALSYVMYRLLSGHPDVDELLIRYMRIQREKIELVKQIVE